VSALTFSRIAIRSSPVERLVISLGVGVDITRAKAQQRKKTETMRRREEIIIFVRVSVERANGTRSY
jgi:hypothetical protein